MKKRKKQTEVQKLENKILRLNRIISRLKRNLGFSDSEKLQLESQKDNLLEQNAEQERIINMFKGCLDKALLEKVLSDDYVRYIRGRYPSVEPLNFSEHREGPSFKYEEPKKEEPK